MKSTGIVRRVDELGRIVLPMELRKSMEIDEKAPLEIYVEGNSIILKKHQCICVFCGETADLLSFQNKYICPACLKKLHAL